MDSYNKYLWKEYKKRPLVIRARMLDKDMSISTPEGVMIGRKGDYHCIGIKDESYIIRSDIFKESYDEVGQ